MVRLEGGLLLSFCLRFLDTKSICQQRAIETHESHNARAGRGRTESRREKVFRFLEHSPNHGTRCKNGRFYLRKSSD